METLELNCERRAIGTKGAVRALRREGRVPAVVYGPKALPTPIAVTLGHLKAGTLGSAGQQRLLKFKSSDPELDGRHVIIKELQHEPIKGSLLHADFYEVDLSVRIQVSVPLRFVGRAKGVADGGILQPLVRTVQVECLPLEIPEILDVDVSPIGIHEAIHVSQVQLGPNISPVFDTDYAVVTVLPPTVEAAAATPAAEEAPAATAAEGEAASAAPTEAAKKA